MCVIYYSDEMTLNYTSNQVNKRQIEREDFECTSSDSCGEHSFVGVNFEDLTFTDEQRAICNDDKSCLFDFAVTGDKEIAITTLEAAEEIQRVQGIISKHKTFAYS